MTTSPNNREEPVAYRGSGKGNAEHLRRILAQYTGYYKQDVNSRFAREGPALHALNTIK
jgi:hypothetical protein